jgi:hypothetical protein
LHPKAKLELKGFEIHHWPMKIFSLVKEIELPAPEQLLRLRRMQPAALRLWFP